MYGRLLSICWLCFFSAYGNIIGWLQAHMFSCPAKKYLHIECPGCGMQRSMIALLQGNLSASWKLYPATIPILFILIFTVLHLRYQFERGANVIKYSYGGIAILITVFYIYKIINHQITA